MSIVHGTDLGEVAPRAENVAADGAGGRGAGERATLERRCRYGLGSGAHEREPALNAPAMTWKAARKQTAATMMGAIG